MTGSDGGKVVVRQRTSLLPRFATTGTGMTGGLSRNLSTPNLSTPVIKISPSGSTGSLVTKSQATGLSPLPPQARRIGLSPLPSSSSRSVSPLPSLSNRSASSRRLDAIAPAVVDKVINSGGQVPSDRLPAIAPAPVVDVAGQALTLSKRHQLEVYEVKWVLMSFQKVKSDMDNGGVTLETFRQFLLRAFDATDVNDKLLEGAYAECKAGKGPLEMDNFLRWYKINMFSSLVASLTADSDMWNSDALIKQVAKKHEVREVDVDKIKKTFNRFDTDKSGELDYLEFEGMIRILLGVTPTADLPKERISRFWKEIDQDGSGCVNFEECAEWYLKYFSPGNPQSGGVLESFYASFMPDKQRGQSLDPQAVLEAQVMRNSAINRSGNSLGSRRVTVE
ncbi:unnamed protein product [Polarella glacialis]|uniref:EF-hand domain-containing protein n=1 Tax=Polarella glacialis TaxID=89957 RepID=A0A813HLY3_POLGL|nr:unnamed protein product [Polarella glacialis]